MRGRSAGDFAARALAQQSGVRHPERHLVGVAFRARRAKVGHAEGQGQGLVLSQVQVQWRAMAGPKRRQRVQTLRGHQACVDAHPLDGRPEAPALEVVPAPAFAFVGVAEQPRFDEARQVMVERGRSQAKVVGQLSGVRPWTNSLQA